MAAPPRPQQGPGGNMSLPPAGNGAAGAGGPPVAEGAGPAAGPELARPQQYTIPGILHYIQHEWARFEMERAHWEVERAELQVLGWGRRAGQLGGGVPGLGVGPGRPSAGARGLGSPSGTYLGGWAGDVSGGGLSSRPRPPFPQKQFPRSSLAARRGLPRGSHFGS